LLFHFQVVAVPDGDAIIMAQKLARTLGIGAGISAGANLLAAIEVQDRLGGDAVVVSIICDDNKKYLSTDLAKKEPVRPGYRCPHVELLTYEVSSLPRPCEDGLHDSFMRGCRLKTEARFIHAWLPA
jgi:cysteine synthase A